MADEIISEVRILESGELLLKLHSGGRPDYSFIYREGVGVYWQPEMHGFISTEKQEWSYSKWFTHIVNTAASCNINLYLSSSTLWANFPEIEKNEITRKQSI